MALRCPQAALRPSRSYYACMHVLVRTLNPAHDQTNKSTSATIWKGYERGCHGAAHMNICVGLGLVISTTKTEVVVSNGPGTASTWRVGAQVLPQSASFKYLGLVFHESGTMSYALQHLAHNAVGACAQLWAKFKGLLCQKSFPMMRRLFDALVLPTVSYGSEVWGPFCSPSSPTLPRDIKKMADVQIAFFRQLCRLKRSLTLAIIFREWSEIPWVHRWGN